MTCYSPFFLLYVRPPRSTLDAILALSTTDNDYIAETIRHAEEARSLARLRTESHLTYAAGNLVWLCTAVRSVVCGQNFWQNVMALL